MATKTSMAQDMNGIKGSFARKYLDRSRGIYSVGIGRVDGEYCIRVSGSERALKNIPATYRGVRVVSRVGAPGIVAIGRLTSIA